MLVLQNKDTLEIINPRVDAFALSPSDLGDFDNWDDALAQNSEADIVDGYAVIEADDETSSAGIKTMTPQLRINTMAGITVEALDSNGQWVVAEPGVSGDFATREEAQEYIDGYSDAVQVADAAW